VTRVRAWLLAVLMWWLGALAGLCLESVTGVMALAVAVTIFGAAAVGALRRGAAEREAASKVKVRRDWK
jgi:hypothetical protein